MRNDVIVWSTATDAKRWMSKLIEVMDDLQFRVKANCSHDSKVLLYPQVEKALLALAKARPNRHTLYIFNPATILDKDTQNIIILAHKKNLTIIYFKEPPDETKTESKS